LNELFAFLAEHWQEVADIARVDDSISVEVTCSASGTGTAVVAKEQGKVGGVHQAVEVEVTRTGDAGG
jgi:hypothetical protein